MSVHIDYSPESKLYKINNLPNIQAIIRLAKNSLRPSAGGAPTRVIDIGCGRGEVMRELSTAGYECAGLDFDAECVKLSEKYGRVVCSDIESIGNFFEAGSFDLVIISHVLEHTKDPAEIIERLKHISKKYILISVPNLCSSKTILKGLRNNIKIVNKGHRFGWDPSHLQTFLECSCNLKVVKWEQDRVLLPQSIAVLLEVLHLRDYIEGRLLTRWFPLFSNSLIVLCEKQ